MILPLPSLYWDYRYMPKHLTTLLIFIAIKSGLGNCPWTLSYPVWKDPLISGCSDEHLWYKGLLPASETPFLVSAWLTRLFYRPSFLPFSLSFCPSLSVRLCLSFFPSVCLSHLSVSSFPFFFCLFVSKEVPCNLGWSQTYLSQGWSWTPAVSQLLKFEDHRTAPPHPV